MTIKRFFNSLYVAFFLVLGALAVFAILLFVNQRQLHDSQRVRFQSYQLADELRQSSDDLTRLARTYVTTGNPKYEEYYWEVLSIRNGDRPRPENYERIYWDFVAAGDSPPVSNHAIPLRQMMRDLGFTEAEFARLDEAQRNSDALVWTETIAMNAVKGRFDDGTGNFTKTGPPDHEMAVRLMHDTAYHREKARIMAPIDRFLAMLDERTADSMNHYARLSNIYITAIGVLLAILTALVTWSWITIDRRVNKPILALQQQSRTVAADVERLAKVGGDIARGGLDQRFTVAAECLGEQSPDEISELSRIQDDMIAKLQETGDVIAQITGELSGRSTALASANKEIGEAMELAKSASRTKSEFLATMSHEIRTPMNAVINMTGLTLETQLDKKQRQFLQVVHSSANALLHLINDILDFSKIEAGKLEIEPHKFRLRQLLDDLADTFRDRVIEKRIEFIVHETPGVPNHLLGDSHRLRQILLNLIGNAFKFTRHGEVALRVELASPKEGDHRTDDSTLVRFSIRDTGIGIPKDKVGMLFQAFTQVDSSISRKFGGTGLGLAICQRLALLMGSPDGIGIESIEGSGSTFSLTLPFEVAHGEEDAEPLELADRFASLRALVAEDNVSTQYLMDTILRGFGMETVIVSDAESALEILFGKPSPTLAGKAAASGVDIVFMDWQLPGMDGITAIRKIREQEKTRDLPVVLMSAFAREHDLNIIERFGKSCFLPKPIKSSLILDSIMDLFGYADEFREPRRRATAPEVRFDGIRLLVAEDNEANQLVATELLATRGIEIVIATDGRQAVEKALAGDYAGVLMDVHMPEVDGLAATQQLREKGYKKPIIAMTASAMKGDQEMCLAAGMDDYITKPISKLSLFSVLARWIPSSAGAPTAGDAADRPAKPAIPEIDGIAVAESLDRLGVSAESFLTMLFRFAEGQFTVLEKLRAGVSQNNHAEVRLQSHSLRGAAGNIGAAALQGCCRDLEVAAERGSGDYQGSLDAIELEFGKVTAGIDKLRLEVPTAAQAPAPSAASTLQPLDPASVLPGLESLAAALEDSDLESIQGALEPLKGAFDRSNDKPAFTHLLRAIDGYEYQQASDACRNLIAKLKN